MPKEITNPLREGLPSKVYYRAFAKPISRYAIARAIYYIQKPHIPPTAKVSNIVRDLLGDVYGKKYLIESESGVKSDITPLLDEIEAELKTHNKALTIDERDELIRFLDNDFRSFVERDYEAVKAGDLNAYSRLLTILGSVVYSKSIINSLTNINVGVLAPQVINLFKEYIATQKDNIELQAIEKVSLSDGLMSKLSLVTMSSIIVAFKPILRELKNISDSSER